MVVSIEKDAEGTCPNLEYNSMNDINSFFDPLTRVYVLKKE